MQVTACLQQLTFIGVFVNDIFFNSHDIVVWWLATGQQFNSTHFHFTSITVDNCSQYTQVPLSSSSVIWLVLTTAKKRTLCTRLCLWLRATETGDKCHWMGVNGLNKTLPLYLTLINLLFLMDIRTVTVIII